MVMTQPERVEKVISASRISICGSVVAGLALGWTYCRMAEASKQAARRHHLFTLACETLTMAEEYVALAPTALLCSVLDDAERLRLEIRQLSTKWHVDLG